MRLLLVAALFLVILKSNSVLTETDQERGDGYASSILKRLNKPLRRVKRSGNDELERATNATVDKGIASIKPKVWIASVVSIATISLVGLAGVAVVPLVQAKYYKHVIQFLVALAVGTLTGDAMLHLLPHAIVASVETEDHASGGEEHGDHEVWTVYKGLVGLAGVYFFFMAEKIVMIVAEYRAEKKADEEERKRALENPRRSNTRRLSSIATAIPQANTARKSSSAMYRRMSRAMSATGEDILTTGLSSKAMRSIDNLIRFAESDDADDGQEVLPAQPQKSLQLTVPGADGLTAAQRHDSDEVLDAITLEVPQIPPKPIASDENHSHSTNKKEVDAVEQGHGHDEKGHSHEEKGEKEKKHGHGHGHDEVPESIAAVAWMVIMGDGLHNFSDGLAIGAAFAQSISGGLSTAVAVFCHELPHELGDFAVLLKTGMKVKEALCLNVLSSFLCFIGMLIGIALGNIESVSYWIFAAVGGMFIYISLVDMLPELSSANIKPGESRVAQFFLQIGGLFTGASIMLTIAMFEEDIKTMIDIE